jgi:hypothetical protein
MIGALTTLAQLSSFALPSLSRSTSKTPKREFLIPLVTCVLRYIYSFKDAIDSGEVKIKHSDLPCFIYANLEKHVYDAEDPEKDAFRGWLLERVSAS